MQPEASSQLQNDESAQSVHNLRALFPLFAMYPSRKWFSSFLPFCISLFLYLYPFFLLPVYLFSFLPFATCHLFDLPMCPFFSKLADLLVSKQPDVCTFPIYTAIAGNWRETKFSFLTSFLFVVSIDDAVMASRTACRNCYVSADHLESGTGEFPLNYVSSLRLIYKRFINPLRSVLA